MTGAPDLSGTLADRFLAKVKRGGADECWLWTGAVDEKGYGRINPGGGGSPIKAHRLAYYLATGEWPEAVLHRCDVPPCCNPVHLFAGDQQANLADMRAKGRQARGPGLAAAISAGVGRGERHHSAVLTDAQRAEIRARYAAGGVTQAELAAEYRVGQATISRSIKEAR